METQNNPFQAFQSPSQTQIVHFFSNHTDTTFIQRNFPDAEIKIIKHPYVQPQWTEEEVYINCSKEIQVAVDADILIINGDYFLVSMILLNRFHRGQKTGFLVMAKSEPSKAILNSNGSITHSNVLTPMGIRWIQNDPRWEVKKAVVEK